MGEITRDLSTDQLLNLIHLQTILGGELSQLLKLTCDTVDYLVAFVGKSAPSEVGAMLHVWIYECSFFVFFYDLVLWRFCVFLEVFFF